MNSFLNNLKQDTNYTNTTNGALTHRSTLNAVLDMFALCGSYRDNSDEDCIVMFKKALAEDEALTMKCLFYLRDVRGGAGERRFFRVCYHWLANANPAAAERNMQYVSEYGRIDDLYCLVDTPLEDSMFSLLKEKTVIAWLALKDGKLGDIGTYTIFKWLKSENASSAETKRLANKTRIAFGMTHKSYRQMLSYGRKQVNVLERLMSDNRWTDIEFDKIPSLAGIKYKEAFARKDEIAEKYAEFAKSKNTKVNAAILNPFDIARKILNSPGVGVFSDVDRAMLQKYWDNLKDYYDGREENGLAVVDVSGSMYVNNMTPLAAAVSMGAYVAEKGHGPFANHFITYSEHPDLVEFEGVDIVDKFLRCTKADWGYNTNIEAVFDMLLNIMKNAGTDPKDAPTRLYIFSDMQFDAGFDIPHRNSEGKVLTLLEGVAEKWKDAGYELPQVVFWNLDAKENIPADMNGRFAYVSGFSMNMLEGILAGKNGWELCYDKLMSDRYEVIS